jgi:hypothetical protein
MSMPVTVLDERFSDPKAVATGWDQTRRALEEAELFWITTVRPDGRPHVTPLVAVWLDGALCFCTGGTEQKAVNLAASPRVPVFAVHPAKVLAFAKGEVFSHTSHRF